MYNVFSVQAQMWHRQTRSLGGTNRIHICAEWSGVMALLTPLLPLPEAHSRPNCPLCNFQSHGPYEGPVWRLWEGNGGKAHRGSAPVDGSVGRGLPPEPRCHTV